MTQQDFLTALAALGPMTFVGGILAGYLSRDHLGRTRHDRRT